MSLSITCIEQQQKDRRTVKKFVIYGLLCSTILHAGVLTLAISGMLDRPPEQEEDAIELIFVEEPEEIVEEPEPEAVLMATHDYELLKQYPGKVLWIKEGVVQEFATSAGFLEGFEE
ncbi:MAG: hypothetical protein F6K34_28440 [Okeania sp. SIO4D6]|nr:hypothetical protein [Okeania sp. SIO4D6]